MAVVLETQLDDVNDENRVENDVVSNSPGNDNGLAVIETIEDESEDEDVDFNPFLKGSPSEEASSSLSSEVEGLDTEVVDSFNVDLSLINESGDKFNEDVGVEVGVGVSCEREVENETVQGGVDNGSTSGVDAVEDVFDRPLVMSDFMGKDTVEFDDEDAICKRTRARYSLASFTLDELETFLQETDDDDDLQNVDDEEEYKKFLAAVLKGGDGDDQGYVEGNDDDDDEDNDADFVIEIQEALESDVEDCVITSQNDEEHLLSSRRPKTRQNRRKKNPSSNKKNGAKREDRPLRPLIPIVYNAADASASCPGSKFSAGPHHTQTLPVTGFVAPQIGQLHCLIYEHVQLLVQVYSLCVLDPSRHHIAAQVKGLLSELLHKRDLVLAWKTAAYPTSCFAPPYIDPTSAQTQNCMPYLSEASDRSDGQGCRWLPPVGDSVHSVLDVEPLKLVEKYMDDVSNAVREHQKRCVETTNFVVEKQPLFPRPFCPSPEINCNSTTGDDQTADACVVSSNDNVPKKTLAATLVENTKRQSVAFVPQQIAKLAEPFCALFNSALFPHKPPPVPVANRVHFTDSEDVLLAMGMMEYNNDWKAIQQRFLPSKSEHQIFVRAKNRSSSKAPDNPIKNVRKLKTSPLTENEKARIEEALQMFRSDWTVVWRAVVPYRDPNLLRRQWRIAIGTQKSYKLPSSKKEEHRLYESTRRTKVAAMGNSLNESKEVNQPECRGVRNINGQNGMENINEAYVHEAFLADWTPNAAGDSASCGSYAVNEVIDNYGNKGSQFTRDRIQEVSCGSEDSHHMNHKSFQPYTNSKFPSKVSPSKTLGREYLMHSQRAQKPGISNLVKLAPELPPVKLPPAVRVISQASLRNSQLVRSTESAGAGYGLENSVPTAVNCAANLAKHVHDKTRVFNSISPTASTHNSESLNNRSVAEDRGDNPQMHPLLFRSLEEGHVLSHPVNNSSIIPTFSFFPALQHQMSGDLRIPHLLGTAAGSKSSSSKEIASTSSSLDFHPFLRRTSDFNAKSFGANSTSSPLTTDLELSRDGYAEELLYRAGTDAAQLVAAASKPTSPDTAANALDLGIHLSSSRKRKLSSDESAETAPLVPSVTVRNVVEDAKRTSNLSDFVASASVGKSGSDDHPAPQIVELGNSSSPPVNDSVRYQPLVEIVMEQEELSDSDEEMEDVEFECEEMTDSDKEEGSVEKLIVNTKHKGQEKTTQTTDVNAQRSKSGTCDISEGSLAQRKGKAPRADLARLGKSSTQGSWLSLNSRDSHNTEQARANDTESSVGVKPVRSHTRPPPRKPKSSRKKSSGEQKTELSGIDPLSISSRKHIKQPIKPPSTSSPDVDVGNSSCAQKDGVKLSG